MNAQPGWASGTERRRRDYTISWESTSTGVERVVLDASADGLSRMTAKWVHWRAETGVGNEVSDCPFIARHV